MKQMFAVMGVLACGAVARAQDPLPQVVPFPLELKRVPMGTSEKERDELIRKFPMLVRGADAEVPDAAKMTQALAALKRQDCDRENECLSQLAKLSGALYGLYANVDFTLDKRAIATGRIVRDDGLTMGPAQSVEVPIKAGAFRVAAQDALKQLLVKLELKKLSPFRPVVAETPPIESASTAAEKSGPPLPPPLVVEDMGSGQRQNGKIVLFAGAGLAAVGAVLAGIGGGIGAGAAHDGSFVTSEEAARQVKTGQTLTTVGFVGLGLGVAAGAVGALMWSSAPGPSVALVPFPGGGAVHVAGQF